MSSSGPRREVAYRVFADEFNDATHTYAESDEERAPNYLVTPTGARVNRLFVVGVLTEVEEVSDDVVRARVVDPTGAFVIYAGQYQPDALAFFERADPPAFVAVTGKARTFQPEGSDRVFTSLRPETVNQVDAETRDRWVVQTAEHTLERVAIFAKALETSLRGQELEDALVDAGVRPGLAAGIPRSIETYGTTTGYLSAIESMAVDAARLVAGEVDAVEREDLEPDEGGDATVDTSFADDVVLEASPEALEEPAETRDPSEDEIGRDAGAMDAEKPADDSEEPQVETRESGEKPPDPGDAIEQSEDETSQAPSTAEPADAVAEDREAEETDPEPATHAETPSEGQDAEEEPPEVAEADPEATDEMYELSEEEREEVKEKYDVGFESGAEIGEPESEPGDMKAEEAADKGPEGADSPIETESDPMDSEEVTHEGAVAESEADEATAEGLDQETSTDGDDEEPASDEPDQADSAPEPDAASEDGSATGETPMNEADLEDVVIETMKSEGDDDGIERGELIESVEAETGAEAEDIEAAIQDALLGGRCFESGEDRLKPI